jgi:putative transposase
MAPTRAQAEKAFDSFQRNFEAKCPKAVTILTKDRESLLALYDFLAEHWGHIRPPILLNPPSPRFVIG